MLSMTWNKSWVSEIKSAYKRPYLYLRRSCIEPAESDPVIHKQTSTNHIAAAIYCAGHKRNLQIIEKVRCVLFDLWPFVAPARGMIAHRPDLCPGGQAQRGHCKPRSCLRLMRGKFLGLPSLPTKYLTVVPPSSALLLHLVGNSLCALLLHGGQGL